MILMIVAVLIVCMIGVASVSATTSVKLQAFNGNTASSTNTLYVNFKLVNTGTDVVALSNVKLRYYFTNDGTQANSFACDWATAGNSNVTGSFVAITAVIGADRYLEVGFASGAGTLAAGASTEVKARVWKSDWSNFTQTNDYSFNSTAINYVDSTMVTAYISGTLYSGTAPDGAPVTTTPPVVTNSPTPVKTATPGTVTATPARTATPVRTAIPTPTRTATPTPTRTVTPMPTVTPTSGVQQKTVRVFWVKPSDVAYDQKIVDGISNVMKEAQRFYFQELGKTFHLNNPIVEVVNGDHPKVWYETDKSITTDPYWISVYNGAAELKRKFGLQDYDPRWVIVEEISAEGTGAGGGGGGHWVLLSEHDVLGAGGYNGAMNRWYGGMVHELGHAFLLPDSTYTDGTPMSASFYSYPNCHFTQAQKDGMLNASLNAGFFYSSY
jgi:hypothetical protein